MTMPDDNKNRSRPHTADNQERDHPIAGVVADRRQAVP